jgi:ABC-type dipeptide/oligopeptide/nickel transport system permease component
MTLNSSSPPTGVATTGSRLPGPRGMKVREAGGAGYLARYIVVRMAQGLATLLAASVVVWLMAAVAPGDPAQRVLFLDGVENPSAAELAQERHKLGLDQSLVHQYLSWLGHALQGNLGTSYISGLPVAAELGSRLAATLILGGIAMVIIVVASTFLGLLSAARAGGRLDVLIRIATVISSATPLFLFGLVVIQVVVLKLGLGVVLSDGSWKEAFLPALCVAIGSIALPTRVLRAAVISAMNENFVVLARARGARRWYALIRHGLPNGGIPMVQALALSAGWLIAGTVVVETVFNWPGVGSYLVSSVEQRDLPVVQAGTLLATLGFLIASLVADVITVIADPRVRTTS